MSRTFRTKGRKDVEAIRKAEKEIRTERQKISRANGR